VQNITLEFRAVAESPANDFRGYFFAALVIDCTETNRNVYCEIIIDYRAEHLAVELV